MLKPYFTQIVIAHESTLVHKTVDAGDTPLGGVLPEGIIAVVGQNRRNVGVHGNHEFVIVNLAQQVLIVEVAVGVKQRFLVICLLYQIEEIEERVTEDICRQATRTLDINHRNEVLFTWQALRHKVL